MAHGSGGVNPRAGGQGDCRIKYVPLDEATVPRDGEVLHNHWWAHDPDLGLLFHRGHGGRLAPQCNRDKSIADLITARLYPGAEVIQVPAVYLGAGRIGGES